MKEKPDVLNDRALLVAYENAISPSKQWKGDLDRVRRKAIAQAQRDADVALYEPLIQQAKFEEIKGLFETIEAMYPELQQVYWKSKGWQSLKGEYAKGGSVNGFPYSFKRVEE